MSGWSTQFAVKRPLEPYKDVLLAKATSTSGLDFMLRCGGLNTMLTYEQ